MLLSNAIKFQKTLALAASASNQFEAEAAELAARRVMKQCAIDPTRIPDQSLYSQASFADNALLNKLRSEYRAQHPKPLARARQQQQQPDDLDDLNVIPFSMGGFSKHARKRKNRAAVQLTHEQHETIRRLYNEGLGPLAIAKMTGVPHPNSTRASHLRLGKWVRDSNGQLQWARAGAGADQLQEPTPTNPQPTDENSEQKAAASSP